MKELNLIRKIAWSFHRTTRIEWDDLFSKAIQSYYDALKRYDPTKSKLTTYINMYITLDLINYLKRQKKINDPLSTLEDTEVMEYPFNNDNSFFEGLSNDANIISNIIIEHPDEFIHLNSTEARILIIKIMKEQGWDKKRIKAGVKEIKKACCNAV